MKAVPYFHSKLIGPVLAMLLASGCASYGVIVNETIPAPKPAQEYSVRSHVVTGKSSDISLTLTFSGGGTRAAALAYGVMLELRDTQAMVDGQNTRLLDEVDTISSVSGGSFTAAYYGLYGDGLFDTFEDIFLRYDIEKHLVRQVLNPLHWFGRKGRTQRAIEYYQKKIFHGATYADMIKPGRPLIVINSSDLAYGVRFSFIQEYFDLLCSDLLSYPVANAVTASSAVPVVFNPVVVENYSDCSGVDTSWVDRAQERAEASRDIELAALAEELESYTNKTQRKYIHFVDGGITDNMGLRAIYDVVTAAGGPEAYLEKTNIQQPDRMIIIAIDASTEPVQEMDASNKQPSIAHSIGALSGVQLHRYNVATLELVETSFYEWADKLSTPQQTIHPYFIELSFENLERPEVRAFFNKVPTSFSLTDEQVDKLIAAGRQLLREHPDFQRLLADLDKS
jgi:NTE family protein